MYLVGLLLDFLMISITCSDDAFESRGRRFSRQRLEDNAMIDSILVLDAKKRMDAKGESRGLAAGHVERDRTDEKFTHAVRHDTSQRGATKSR